MRIIEKLVRVITGANRKLKRLRFKAKEVIALESEFQKLTDEQLQAKTADFKKRLAAGETLDDLLVEAFATVREASRRVLGMMHFEEQIMGGIAMHKGMMAEMKTGEGKTLVATLPSYLNALTGDGVHIVTVNDYLAKRDADEMGQIHRFLGLTAGCILETLEDHQRKKVYANDIVYATNNQLGFDYLKDNMKYDKAQVCMRGLNYAIIDEADSVLIDEARTPLIISGPSDQSSDSAMWISDLVRHLTEADYEKDEKMRTVTLTEQGIEKVESLLRLEGVLTLEQTLYDVTNIELVHALNQALKAHTLFRRDIDYIVKDDKVYIIDEFTGRILDGRRYSDGLHQAIEAKENVEVQAENHTMASITFQRYFALYNKIAGMSGTCVGEAEEFAEIYKVSTIAIPTHRPMIRKDLDDEIYRTFNEKFDVIVREVKESHEKGQPVLVITGSIEASDVFSRGFAAAGLPHQILNARKHKEEAEIIADAGVPGAITIATNMAGRGTDIQLGGNLKSRLRRLRNNGLSEAEIEALRPGIEKEIAKAREVVINAGGLYVLGTERNESRRVDDQARGRAGRQGDVGKSKFFLSLEDNLIRIFGSSSKLDKWLLRFGLKEGEPITHPFVSRAIEKAQNAVEARNFDWRKNVFKYDHVLDEQRKMIYRYRNRFLNDIDIKEQMLSFVRYKADLVMHAYLGDEFDLHNLHQELMRLFGMDLQLQEILKGLDSNAAKEKVSSLVLDKFERLYEVHESSLKMILLKTIDDLWREHLYRLDALRQNTNLKAYAQKDPLNEYKKEAFIVFENLLETFRDNSISFFFHLGTEEVGLPDMLEDTLS